MWIKASKYQLKLLIHTSFLISNLLTHLLLNKYLQWLPPTPPPPQHLPPHPQFFVSRWQTCLKFLATIFVNERQRDWVNFTHQRGLPIFSGTMGCWIFSIFTRFNMFLRFYQQLSKPMILTSSMYLTPLGKNPLSAIYLPSDLDTNIYSLFAPSLSNKWPQCFLNSFFF